MTGMTAPPASSPPLAAVDLGSNSFRLEIGELEHGRYRRIESLKETVRLGAGLDTEGMLGESAAARGLDCLRRFAERLGPLPATQVRAVATQTLREARNRDAFLQRARSALGQPIEVISGREEARLIYAGVALLQPPRRQRLVVDIGGRSTELIVGHGRTPSAAESFPVGSVSLSLRYFPGGRIDAAAFTAAQVAAAAEFEEALATFDRSHWSEALGSSGTVGAVAQLLQAAGVTDGAVTPEGLRWCIERCIEAGHVDRLVLPGLRDDRRPILPGGLAILYTLACQFGIAELMAARGALRQGVIADLHERLQVQQHARRGDLRDHTVQALQRRFAVDAAQAGRVGRAALAFFDAVCPQAEGDARRELGWACALHEAGLMVSHHDHHRHSAYLLDHADAPGFSQSQQRRVGALVLGQRGGLRKIETSLAQPGFAWQVLCLRLAVIVCHARSAAAARPALRLTALPGGVPRARLALPARLASTHPQTMHLLAAEAEAWARTGVLHLATVVASA